MKSSIHRFRISRDSPSQSNCPPTSSQTEQPPGSAASHGVEETPLPPASKSGHIPACDRCRSFKKKCSRTFPVCSLCASAGQKCSFSTPASSATAQAHHLRARVEWLTRYMNEILPVGSTGIEAFQTGADLSELLQAATSPSNAAVSHNGTSPLSSIYVAGQNALSTVGDQTMQLEEQSIEVTPDSQSPSSTGHHSIVQSSLDQYEGFSTSVPSKHGLPPPRLPADAVARRFVDAYFRNVNRAYPFVDRNKVLNDLEVFGDFAKRRRDPDSTLLYLIMAIGCTTLQRAGQIPGDTASKFEVAYSDIIQECLCREGIESVQILVLLALYSLFDPTGASAWSILGIVSRQAMLLGVTRRASDDKMLSATEIELRHRLFWSIYVLDRMMATSLGLPVALTDENMDVPLPGLTIEEFASPDRTKFAMILQTSRHVIQLRQMEDRILKQVHFRKQSEISTLTHADRRAILHDIHAEVENWYSNGCLVSPMEPDNVPIHNSITWLSARYYYLLLLLYYPCHFNFFAPGLTASISKAELLRFAQKHIQSTSALFQQRQLPLNRVTLCRLFPVGLVFMHGCIACAADCIPYPARDDVALLLNILDAFPDGWTNAHKAAQILRQFLTILAETNYGPLQFSNASFQQMGGAGGRGATKESYCNMMRPSLTSYLALMQDILGKATCYRFLEIPDDGSAGMVGAMGTPVGPSSRSSTMGGISGMVGGGEDSVMNYGWEPVELDFL